MIKYTQSYLDSLKGLSVIEVKAKVRRDLDKHVVAYQQDQQVIAQIAGDYVNIWHDENHIVIKATAGDPCQLE